MQQRQKKKLTLLPEGLEPPSPCGGITPAAHTLCFRYTTAAFLLPRPSKFLVHILLAYPQKQWAKLHFWGSNRRAMIQTFTFFSPKIYEEPPVHSLHTRTLPPKNVGLTWGRILLPEGLEPPSPCKPSLSRHPLTRCLTIRPRLLARPTVLVLWLDLGMYT